MAAPEWVDAVVWLRASGPLVALPSQDAADKRLLAAAIPAAAPASRAVAEAVGLAVAALVAPCRPGREGAAASLPQPAAGGATEVLLRRQVIGRPAVAASVAAGRPAAPIAAFVLVPRPRAGRGLALRRAVAGAQSLAAAMLASRRGWPEVAPAHPSARALPTLRQAWQHRLLILLLCWMSARQERPAQVWTLPRLRMASSWRPEA